MLPSFSSSPRSSPRSSHHPESINHHLTPLLTLPQPTPHENINPTAWPVSGGRVSIACLRSVFVSASRPLVAPITRFAVWPCSASAASAGATSEKIRVGCEVTMGFCLLHYDV